MFYLYILYSANLDSYYVGATADVAERLKRHLSNHHGYTAKAKDWEIVYTATFESKTEALAREKMIKSWKSKILIKKLIEEK